MAIEFDEAKRAKTLRERGLDFARADEVFGELNVTAEDPRQYTETRYIT